MQVGLTHSGLSLTTPVSTGSVNTPSAVRRPNSGNVRPNDNRFPESPLISTRPLRYNVQLNQQLTSVQQADNYLSRVEGQLLQLRYATQNGRRGALLEEAAGALDNLLNHRLAMSQQTVDRNLAVTLEQPARVTFTLPAAQRLLQSDEAETVIFSVAGQRREMVAVALEAGSSPRQQVLRLNTGLGRFGIHATMDSQQQLSFSVEEKNWQQVSSQLSVRGEDKRFSSSFTALLARPENSISDTLSEVARQPQRMRELQGDVQKALEQLTQQRSHLFVQQENVRRRIDEMDAQYPAGDALGHARALRQHLEGSAGNYASVARAVGAQANLQPGTVKNLLT
ncbi:hypothetical protein GJV04_06465 [Enterobacteriaceae bacterium RIT714]|nr:hypothetical protein [Enterobacteriaceae bacterium RIT714]